MHIYKQPTLERNTYPRVENAYPRVENAYPGATLEQDAYPRVKNAYPGAGHLP
jgi:hypothetical protein